MALGGFASVVAALGRPLGPVRRQRFLALLFLALTQVLSCLIPIWMENLAMDSATMWRIASLLSFAITLCAIILTVIVPLRRIGFPGTQLLTPTLRILLNAITVVSVLLLPLNAAGFPWGPGFAPYYASLLLAFVAAFIVFADVVLIGEPTP